MEQAPGASTEPDLPAPPAPASPRPRPSPSRAPRELFDKLAATRQALRAALRREAAVVAATAALAALLITALLALGPRDRFVLAWTELLIAIAGIGFVTIRYELSLRRATDASESTAAWLDGALGRRDSRGSVLAALELSRDRGRFGESERLADAAVREIELSLERVDVRAVVFREAWASLRKKLLGLLAVSLALGTLTYVRPAAVRRAASAMFADGSDNPLLPALPEARLADFRITYRAPAYAERAPATVESSSGDLRGLPGTWVTIDTRAHEPLSSAAVVVTYGTGEEETLRLAAEVSDRRIHAQLVLSRSGRYRFELTTSDGKRMAQKSGQRIELEPDLPPSVRLQKPTASPFEVNENDRVELAFRADDDFGLSELRVAWRVLGSPREGKQKLSVDNGSASYRGTAAFELQGLGLKPGDRVAYSVEAVDNDTVNGPKVGGSETKELKVYSKDEHHEEVLRLADKALDELVHVLGDQLERPLGPTENEAAALALVNATEKGIDRAAAAGLLLDEAIAALAKDPLGKKQVADAFKNAKKDLTRETRAFAVAFRGARARQERSAAAETMRAQSKLVTTLEKHTVYLADLLNDTRMMDAEALTKQLRDQQERLREALAEYKRSPTEAAKKALEATIADIRRKISEISSKLASLRGAIPEDLVGSEAMEARSTEKGLEEVSKKIESGDLDGALEDLDRMLKSTEEMISKMQAGRNELGEREFAQVSETAQQLWSELGDTKEQQKLLEDATQKLSKHALERMKSRLGDVSSFIEKQRDRLAEAAKLIESAEPAARVSEGDVFEQSLRRLDDTGRALEARDFGAGAEMAEAARDAIRQLRGDLERRTIQIARFGDFFGSSEGLGDARDTLGRAEPKVQSVLDDLEKLIPKPEQLLTPEERKQLEGLSDRQNETGQRARRVQQLLDRLGEELPIVGENAKQLAEETRAAMDRASEAMSKGDARSAGSEQRQAMESIGRLEEALRQMGQSGGGGGGGGVLLPFGQEGEGNGGEPRQTGDGANASIEKVAIPQPEQFEAPAAFRQDILEAAKHGAARGYEDSVRRYYEEIVK